jgi:hypothetical protein
MKIYKVLIALFLLVILFWLPAFAQENSSRITGIVLTPEKEPSQFSTIILMNRDSVFLKGTLSNNDGSFQFEKMEPGQYFIMVRNMEFNTFLSQPVNLQPNQVFTLDTITLETKIMGLEEIVVKGEKALIEIKPDKMVYNVSASANASGNNGLELLSKTPGVLVDLDKNIVLQGKSGVRIYINGRPSRLSGSDLTNYLEGMRSDDIEAIDIITNPSAKYEAEGSGGIIDIQLKRNISGRFNGNIIGNYSKGQYDRSSLGTTLNFNREKVNFFGNLNVSENNGQEDFVQTTIREKYILDLESYSQSNQKSINFNGGLDYKINSENTLGLDAKISLNNRKNELNSNTIIEDIANIDLTERLYSEVIDDSPSENYNMNVYYNFSPNGSSNFSADLSLGKYTNDKNTLQPNIYYDINDNILRTVDSEYDALKEIDIVSGKIDYEKRFNRFNLGAGAKYSYISTDNSLKFYNLENGIPIIDIDRSNDFSYLEKVAAAYFTFGAKLSEKVSLNSGLRVENTSSLGELESAKPTEDDVVARNYTSWFPNVSLSYDDQKNHGISLSYGRRITRPNYQDLNPFENKLSEISSWKGNPFLKPNYISNYQLSYSFKRKLVISNNFSVTRDFFANIFEVVDDLSTILIPRNMERVLNNGLSASYSNRVFKWWNFTSFVIYNYEKYDGDLNGTIIDLETHKTNFRLQNNFNLPQKVRFEVSYFYSSPWIWRGSVNVQAFHRIDLGLKREFFKDRLLVQLTANDLLNTSSDFAYKSNYGGMIVDGVISFDNRRFGISVTYNLGNQQLKTNRRKKSAIDDEMQRISG